MSASFIEEYGTKIRKVAGILCIAAPIAVLVIGLYMAVSNTFPSDMFETDESSGRYIQYSQERYDELVSLLSNEDEENADADEIKAAEQNLHQCRLHLLKNFVFKWGALPYIALFVCWLVFAIKTKGTTQDQVSSKRIVLSCILFIIGGFVLFTALPAIALDFVGNIHYIMTLIMICVIAWIVIRNMGNGGAPKGEKAPRTADNGRTKIPKNIPAGAVMSKQHKYIGRNSAKKDPDSNGNLTGMKEGAKVKTVSHYLELRRAESAASGEYIGIVDGNAVRFVCSQYDYDHGNVVIIDEYGQVRKV